MASPESKHLEFGSISIITDPSQAHLQQIFPSENGHHETRSALTDPQPTLEDNPEVEQAYFGAVSILAITHLADHES